MYVFGNYKRKDLISIILSSLIISVLITHSYVIRIKIFFLIAIKKKKKKKKKWWIRVYFAIVPHIPAYPQRVTALASHQRSFRTTKREQQIRARRRWCTVSVALWTHVLRFHSISSLRLIIARSRRSFRKSNVFLSFARNFVTSILISPVSMGRLKYTRTYREKYFALSRLFYHFSHVNVSCAVRYWTPLISCNLRSIVEHKIPERFVSSFWTKYWVCPCYFRD